MSADRALPRWGRWGRSALRAAVGLYGVWLLLSSAPDGWEAVRIPLGVIGGLLFAVGGVTWLAAELREGWRSVG